MMMPILIVSMLLACSLGANLFLLFKHKRQKARPESVELKEFLMDLMGGNGLIHVTRISPSDVLLRSPRRQ